MVDGARREAIRKLGSVPLLAAGVGAGAYGTRGIWYPYDDTLDIPDLEEAVRDCIASRPVETYAPLDRATIDVDASFAATDWPEKEYAIALTARPAPDADVSLCPGEDTPGEAVRDGFEALLAAAYGATGQYTPPNRMPYEEAVTGYRLSARGDDGLMRLHVSGEEAHRYTEGGVLDGDTPSFRDLYDDRAAFVCF